VQLYPALRQVILHDADVIRTSTGEIPTITGG
jgi:hypothetical protein